MLNKRKDFLRFVWKRKAMQWYALNNEYKNRVYTEEEIEKLISPKKKRGRPRKEQ